MARPTTAFELQRLAIVEEGHDAWCRVLKNGKTLVERTDGTDLAAQVELGGGHALFLTYDSPFDEGLHVLYFDADDRLRDEARLGFLYPGGIGLLSDLRFIDDTTVEFDFYGRWRLSVDARGRVGIAPGPPGVSRPWRHWLRRRFMRFESLQP